MSISARAKLNEIAFNFEYSNNSQYSQVELKFVTKMHRLYEKENSKTNVMIHNFPAEF